MKTAVAALLEGTEADRAAVWVDSYGSNSGSGSSFRGVVAERSGEAPAAEWTKLSLDAVHAPQLLIGGECVDQAVDAPNGVDTGVLLEMRRAVWAPICTEHELRGVVLVASRSRQPFVEKPLLEGVAAELAVALLLVAERQHGRERQEDLGCVRRMLSALARNESVDALLAQLVESCVSNAGGLGRRAVFAAIGELNEVGSEVVRFLWRSGDAAWTAALYNEPVSIVWRQALERRHVTGNEPGHSGAAELARIVALPLHAGGEQLGVLVAGLPHENASLAGLERLELRAGIASQILWERRRTRDIERGQDREMALVEAGQEAVAFLDNHGTIRKLNAKARLLLDRILAPAAVHDSGLRDFGGIFQPRERERVEQWLDHQVSRPPATQDSPVFAAELANGLRVALQVVPAAATHSLTVLFKPLREEAQADNREQTELLNVIEWLEEGVVLFDDRQEIRAMNSRFVQMTGLTPEQHGRPRNLQGLIARLATQTSEPERFASHWLASAHGGHGGVRDEVHLLHPVPRVLERATRPLLNKDGKLLGRVEIYRDLTAQRAFHSKLIQTEKLAALGQTVTSIAHELSNPLTSILGYAQRLLRHQAGEQANQLRQILSEAERASTIVRQMLLTPRDAHPSRRKVALNEVVVATVNLQRAEPELANVRVEVDLDPSLPPVFGDAGRLQQVLRNLLANARQAIELAGKGGTIRVRTKRAGGTHALLEVIDDGPGVPATILAKIFDPFFTTKPAGVGTGLGLSIVLGIVREHGGQVRVASPSGGGAVFSVELPAAPATITSISPPQEEDADDSEASRALAPEGVLSPWAGSRVLVVEDEATVAQLIADVLREEGLQVEILVDGREALRRLSSQDYDLVICDMKMPDLDGEQLYRRLARSQNPLKERMLFVTGDVLAAHTRDFLERNHLPHLAKPFRVEELTATVRQVLMELNPRKSRAAKTSVARS